MLKYRIISACMIGATFLLTVHFLPPLGVLLVALAVSVLCQLEFYTMANKAGIPVFRWVGVGSGVLLIASSFFCLGQQGAGASTHEHQWEQFVLLGSLIAVLMRQFPQKNNSKPIETIACTLLGIWYVPYLFNYFTRLGFSWDGTWQASSMGATGRYLVLYLVIVIKFTDIGAFVVGSLVGRHPCFPRISPKKTWEGLAGGIGAAMLASVLFYWFTGGDFGAVRLHWHDAVILGGLLGVVSVVGDLFESLVKRAAGMKDSSRAVPGMGGVLDVIDSLLFGAPVMYVYARLFLT